MRKSRIKRTATNFILVILGAIVMLHLLKYGRIILRAEVKLNTTGLLEGHVFLTFCLLAHIPLLFNWAQQNVKRKFPLRSLRLRAKRAVNQCQTIMNSLITKNDQSTKYAKNYNSSDIGNDN
jgi:hypothetical protein